MVILHTVLARHWDPRTGAPIYLQTDDGSNRPLETDGPLVYPRIDADNVERRMLAGLLRLAKVGCHRLTPPSSCRREIGGYPEPEWCEGCIAAEALNLPRDWFVLR
jgi:hypothetical protein